MFDYLMPAEGPVIPELEEHEVVYAKNQPEYNPLRTIRSTDSTGRVLSRWTLSESQRRAVMDGADIFLELLTFNGPLQPILLAVGDSPNADYFREQYALPNNAIVKERKD